MDKLEEMSARLTALRDHVASEKERIAALEQEVEVIRQRVTALEQAGEGVWGEEIAKLEDQLSLLERSRRRTVQQELRDFHEREIAPRRGAEERRSGTERRSGHERRQEH